MFVFEEHISKLGPSMIKVIFQVAVPPELRFWSHQLSKISWGVHKKEV